MKKRAVFELWHFCWSQMYFFCFSVPRKVSKLQKRPQNHESVLFWFQILRSWSFSSLRVSLFFTVVYVLDYNKKYWYSQDYNLGVASEKVHKIMKTKKVNKSYFGFKVLDHEDETFLSWSLDTPFFVTTMMTSGLFTDRLHKCSSFRFKTLKPK